MPLNPGSCVTRELKGADEVRRNREKSDIIVQRKKNLAMEMSFKFHES